MLGCCPYSTSTLVQKHPGKRNGWSPKRRKTSSGWILYSFCAMFWDKIQPNKGWDLVQCVQLDGSQTQLTLLSSKGLRIPTTDAGGRWAMKINQNISASQIFQTFLCFSKVEYSRRRSTRRQELVHGTLKPISRRLTMPRGATVSF